MRAGEGIALTQKGSLARAVVVEAVERFGWQPLPNPPRGEDDVFELWVLRDLAQDLGAVRRSGWRLVATRAGCTLAGDAEALWRVPPASSAAATTSARSSPTARRPAAAAGRAGPVPGGRRLAGSHGGAD